MTINTSLSIGKWKMSHYFAEKMFAPVLVSPVYSTDENQSTLKEEVDVYIVSELFEQMDNLILEISVQRFDQLDEASTQSVMIGKIYVIIVTNPNDIPFDRHICTLTVYLYIGNILV